MLLTLPEDISPLNLDFHGGWKAVYETLVAMPEGKHPSKRNVAKSIGWILGIKTQDSRRAEVQNRVGWVVLEGSAAHRSQSVVTGCWQDLFSIIQMKLPGNTFSYSLLPKQPPPPQAILIRFVSLTVLLRLNPSMPPSLPSPVLSFSPPPPHPPFSHPNSRNYCRCCSSLAAVEATVGSRSTHWSFYDGTALSELAFAFRASDA